MAQGSKYQPKLLRYVFDPLKGLKIKPKDKKKALREVGDFVLDAVLEHVSGGRSPVGGEPWKKSLSKAYLGRKDDVSSSTIANMELFGDMLDALNIRVFNRTKLALEITGTQAEKADGHNKLTGRVNKSLKIKRRFIPGESQKFKRAIESGIKEIAREFEDGDSD